MQQPRWVPCTLKSQLRGKPFDMCKARWRQTRRRKHLTCVGKPYNMCGKALSTCVGTPFQHVWERPFNMCGNALSTCAEPFQHVQRPVEASEAQQMVEIVAVQQAAAGLCPLQLALERVVISPAGVVMACWQLLKGTEPVDLRHALQVPSQPEPTAAQSLPYASQALLYRAPGKPCCTREASTAVPTLTGAAVDAGSAAAGMFAQRSHVCRGRGFVVSARVARSGTRPFDGACGRAGSVAAGATSRATDGEERSHLVHHARPAHPHASACPPDLRPLVSWPQPCGGRGACTLGRPLRATDHRESAVVPARSGQDGARVEWHLVQVGRSAPGCALQLRNENSACCCVLRRLLVQELHLNWLSQVGRFSQTAAKTPKLLEAVQCAV